MKELKVKNILKIFLIILIGFINPNYKLNIKDLTHIEFNIGFILALILLILLMFILMWYILSIN